jgi:hypothetical protein
MGCGLPAGLDPVMTGRAGTGGHPHMFERCARPGHSSMATIAGHCGREMRGGLSLCGIIVMTLRAAARCNPVVSKEGWSPGRGAVAAVTIGRGRQVVRGFKSGYDSPARRMTLHTLRRRSSKDPLQVASLARDLRVAATEREASAAVVDFHIGTISTILGLSLARQQEAKAQDQRG